jgi:DNA-binding NtrC family response regulator
MARVLLVDDESFFMHSATQAMVSRGHSVRATSSAQVAMRALGARRFHLVIAKHQLRSGDGLSLLRRVRDLHPTARRILVTDRIAAGAGQAAAERGEVTHLLVIPCSVGDLIAAAEQQLRSLDVREIEPRPRRST